MSAPPHTWTRRQSEDFGRRPLIGEHGLHRDPLFGPDAVAELIQVCPAGRYRLVDAGGEPGSARSGEIGDLTGREVLEWIGAGRLALDLLDPAASDGNHAGFAAGLAAALREEVPDLDTPSAAIALALASPGVRTPARVGLPARTVWQIAGAQRLVVWPAETPPVDARALEAAALAGGFCALPADPCEREALSIDLEPGVVVAVPPGAPFRLESRDGISVALVAEHWTAEIRRCAVAHAANGLMRRIGIAPQACPTAGPAYAARAALVGLSRGLAALPGLAVRPSPRPADFRLARSRPGAVVDLSPATG